MTVILSVLWSEGSVAVYTPQEERISAAAARPGRERACLMLTSGAQMLGLGTRSFRTKVTKRARRGAGSPARATNDGSVVTFSIP